MSMVLSNDTQDIVTAYLQTGEISECVYLPVHVQEYEDGYVNIRAHFRKHKYKGVFSYTVTEM